MLLHMKTTSGLLILIHGVLSLPVATVCDKKLGVLFHEGIILQSNNDHLFCFKAGIPKAVRQLVSKLAECCWLFNKVKNNVETRVTMTICFVLRLAFLKLFDSW